MLILLFTKNQIFSLLILNKEVLVIGKLLLTNLLLPKKFELMKPILVHPTKVQKKLAQLIETWKSKIES